MTIMRIAFSLTLFLLSIGLTGCVTTYKEAAKDSPHATVEGASGASLLSPAKVRIYEINGLPIDEMWKGYAAKRRIPVGKNSVYVSAIASGRLTAFAYIEFDAKPGQSYVITQESHPETFLFIIYNKDTKKIAAQKREPKVESPQHGSTVVPIFL